MTGLLLFLEQPLLDDRLGGDPGVVGAWHPETVISLHPPPADQDILKRVVQRMAQVQRSGDIGRRNHDAVSRPVTGWIGVEVTVLNPELVPPILGILGIILLGDLVDIHADSLKRM